MNFNYARYELSYINFMEKLPNETYNEAFPVSRKFLRKADQKILDLKQKYVLPI